MTSEFKSRALFFSIIIAVTVVAWSFPADSQMRALLLPVVGLTFLLGLIWILIREGWNRDRRRAYGGSAPIVRTILGLALLAVSVRISSLAPTMTMCSARGRCSAESRPSPSNA